MTPRILLPLAALAALAACTVHSAGPEAAIPPKADLSRWRTIATRDDHRRLSDWRKAWMKALGQARPRHQAEIAAEGALLDPDAALAAPTPPPGEYRCRTIKLGTREPGRPDYVVGPVARCRVDAGPGGTLTFAKVTGTQRPIGRIFPETSRRMVFLGTLQLGDEPGTLRYGHDLQRDLTADVERVGERRWRLVFPYPHFESTLDVIELVPAR